MGRIFSYREIVARRIPSVTNDFPRAKDIALTRLAELAREGIITGAKVYGSVGHGTHTVRSGLNVLILKEKPSADLKIAAIGEEIDRRTYVPFEPLIFDREEAERGRHSLDSFHLSHLQDVPQTGNTAYRDPLPMILPSGDSVEREYQTFLERGLTYLKEAPDQYADSMNPTLQKILETSTALGRNLLKFYGHTGVTTPLHHDTKKEVSGKFDETFHGTEFFETYQQLQIDNAGYTGILQLIQEGMVLSKDQYVGHLAKMYQDNLPKARQLTQTAYDVFHGNLELLLSQMEGRNALGKEM